MISIGVAELAVIGMIACPVIGIGLVVYLIVRASKSKQAPQ